MNDKKLPLTAYEKAAKSSVDPRCIPQRLEGDVPVGDMIVYPVYSAEENETWSILYNRQMELLEGRVCDEYIQGVSTMGFDQRKIPALAELSSTLEKSTGWKIARVPGLIHEHDFFDLLRQRIFPSTDYIRRRDELDYTPAPDMFHDIFGHLPLLTNISFANFYQKFGIAALNAKADQHIRLERFHWFTAEFGLVRNPQGLRIYGAGIVSSLNEVVHSLSEDVKVRAFQTEDVVMQEYEVWHLQPILFAIESFAQLESDFDRWTQKQGLT
jgi:phenylalanine-4-hydroxylase